MAFVSSAGVGVTLSSGWIGSAAGRRPRYPCARRSRPAVTMDSAPAVPVPDTSMAALVNADNDKRVNIGIIGAGRIGQVHADNISFRLKNANLVAISSGSKQLADRCSLEHGCQPYYEYEQLLENPDLDAVCICSASNQHTAQIVAAAEAGKHIFVEKPIDTDLEVITTAMKAVKKAGVKCQVGFNRRFDTNYARVKAAIESGEIGDPHMVRITSRDPSPPPEEYIKSSGGIWMDCTIHDFDMCRWLVGDEVEEVYALGAVNIVPAMEKYGDVDTSLVTLKFKNGVIGSIDNSRQAVYGYDQRCEVFGSGGQIAINNNYANSAVISTNEKIQRDLPLHFFMDRYTDSFITELNDFCNCILEDKPVPCTTLDGRAPVVIAIAAKKSYTEGRPVKISEVDLALPEDLVGWDGQ
eukprot:CAMPEP_0198326736 /NCGR_PEP_ID=MMETSP1450-20131203/14167_1 /TAXON_ID=753684 ORGANISM="Madagascaria erythrocladiodes, Strain CCMP3234" /NCGR_SAMPLE_ID=MMETSP1450 /ASSEMBLY_ACC=CAM_ASM_001115 /LENGTH=410 /DNA_ID=CAMNT_0044030723 /DNA_START=71 /DNA_END=1303 /DNA_ORIENTATION=-